MSLIERYDKARAAFSKKDPEFSKKVHDSIPLELLSSTRPQANISRARSMAD